MDSATRDHIRGSSLLLAGRLLSASINFATQLLMVRYLSTRDFGTFAYALVVVSSCYMFSTLGLNKAVTRFVPFYQEKGDHGRLFGTIVLILVAIAVSGMIFTAAVYAVRAANPAFFLHDEQPILLLCIMILMVPLEALDGLLLGLFASLASARAIFLRRHLLGPLLRLLAVVLLVIVRGDLFSLAYAYLTASALGTLTSCLVLIRLFRRRGLFRQVRHQSLTVPARDLLAFSLPLLTTELLGAAMHLGCVFLLGFFRDAAEVAAFRVVLPAAQMNELVMVTFAVLYVPSAARFLANDDRRGLRELYWRTAVWMAVLSFPIFALTFSVAQPFTVLLYGVRYEQSGIILALLSLGYYFNVAFGFNALTLKVLGEVRTLVVINVMAALANITLNLLLIPPYGALGAAIATTSSMILVSILNQAGLRRASGLGLFDKTHLPFYLILGGSALALFLVRPLIGNNIAVALALAVLVSLFVLALSKRRLNIGGTFPELSRLPLLRLLVA